MFSEFRRAAPLSAAFLLALPAGAMAHAVCGPRTFPVTLTLDDPGVADEASLPTFTYQHSGASDGPGTAPSDIQTAWTMAPGVIWMADWYQVGMEALVPLNKAAGTNVGVIAQFHVFLDDLLPNTLGKPIVEWFE
jgi:hypothetical protein